MSVKSMKAVVVVVMIALLVGPASFLWVAADSHGAMTQLEPGAQHWYTLAYPGSGTVEVHMDVDPAGGAGFMIVTADAVRAWEAGGELVATGGGAHNPNEGADLFWSGSFGQAGDYYLVVEYSGDGAAVSSYSLDVSGAEVFSDVAGAATPAAGADGLWCYAPVFDQIAPIVFEPYVGDPNKAFSQVPYVSEWTGFLNGSSTDYGLVIGHVLAPDTPAVPVTFIDTSTFVKAEVGGKVGGLELNAIGAWSNAASEWQGMWMVTSGTGDLAGLQAHGTFWGPGWMPPDGGSDECPEGMGVVYYSVDG